MNLPHSSTYTPTQRGFSSTSVAEPRGFVKGMGSLYRAQVILQLVFDMEQRQLSLQKVKLYRPGQRGGFPHNKLPHLLAGDIGR